MFCMNIITKKVEKIQDHSDLDTIMIHARNLMVSGLSQSVDQETKRAIHAVLKKTAKRIKKYDDQKSSLLENYASKVLPEPA